MEGRRFEMVPRRVVRIARRRPQFVRKREKSGWMKRGWLDGVCGG